VSLFGDARGRIFLNDTVLEVGNSDKRNSLARPSIGVRLDVEYAFAKNASDVSKVDRRLTFNKSTGTDNRLAKILCIDTQLLG
jgi:hypothetical protein